MSEKRTHRLGIIMNGVTGRMGTNQHLFRSILAIRNQGGVRVSEGEVIMPDPILVGRNPAKLEDLAIRAGLEKWTTSLEDALSDTDNKIYFDSQTTSLRVDSTLKAIDAGKHVYLEKPVASTTEEAIRLYRAASAAGIKHGVVQDKLWLPGIRKLKTLIDSGFFGRILSIRGEFGYWVFEGETVAAQRPSWNYRKEDGGGIILDMFPHWRYLLDQLFGQVKGVSCLAATHIERRWDEKGKPYECTAEDSAYSTFLLEGGVVAHFNSSWVVRVRRDDLLTLQVDGTEGTAVAGLRECLIQPRGATPKPIWNPDIERSISYFDHWIPVPPLHEYDNAFKAQWELFLRHVVLDEPFPWDVYEGAKGVQLAEKGLESWQQRRWIDVPVLNR